MSGLNKSPLGNHIELLTGYPFKSELYTESETSIALLRGDNVIQGSIRWDDAKRWPKNLSVGLEKYHLREGDFVIAMDRTWVKSGLKAAIITNNDIPCILVQRVARLRPKKSLDPYFLSLLIRSHQFEQYVKGVQTETAVPHISPQQIKDFLVALPPLPEQTAIAYLLSTWDVAIEKAERLIAAKEKQYLWFSKKHLFGNATDTANASKKTKWFSVPDHWKIVNIGKIASEVSSYNNSGDNIPVLSCTKYDGLVNSLTYFDKQVFSQDTSKYKVVAKGQFAYATNHIEEGSIGYQDVYDKGLVSPMYTVFETNNNIDDSYLYKVFKSVVYLHIFRANTSSSVDRRGSLRWKEFTKLPIPLPPIEEQKQIAAILITARQEIDLLKKQADACRRQKRGLMQRLLTGEWRVKTGPEVVQ